MTPGTLLLAELNKRLAQAFAPNDADDGSAVYQRIRYAIAMRVLGDFIESSGGEPAIAGKIVELASMLMDLDNGVVAAVLRPSTPGNRPIDPSNVHSGRALAALGIYALVKDGKSREEAARIAAKSIPNLARLCSQKASGSKSKASTPQSAVLSWYDEFRKGRAKNHQAVVLFKQGCADIERVRAVKGSSAFAESAQIYFNFVALGLSPHS
jgi:hypothetical protein